MQTCVKQEKGLCNRRGEQAQRIIDLFSWDPMGITYSFLFSLSQWVGERRRTQPIQEEVLNLKIYCVLQRIPIQIIGIRKDLKNYRINNLA